MRVRAILFVYCLSWCCSLAGTPPKTNSTTDFTTPIHNRTTSSAPTGQYTEEENDDIELKPCVRARMRPVQLESALKFMLFFGVTELIPVQLTFVFFSFLSLLG